MSFKNDAKACDRQKLYGPIAYGFDHPPTLMFRWGRKFQAIISQVGSYYFSQHFHDRDCDIPKTESGCVIEGRGRLVLGTHRCHFDSYGPSSKEIEKAEQKMSELIIKIVLEWDPNTPIYSMVKTGAEFIEVEIPTLNKVIEATKFSADFLCDFFDHNPFDSSRDRKDEAYERFCLINFHGKTKQEVDQKFADEELGAKLLKQINERIRKADPNGYRSALCCSPKRFESDPQILHFWINTGRSTQIDGWKTEADIKKFIASDGKLNDTMR